MNGLIPSFYKSLYEPVVELSTEYLELGLDTILSDPTLQHIPICSTILGLCKGVCGIRERWLFKQLVHFTHAFHDGTLSSEQLAKHREQLERDPKRQEKELGRVLLLLQKHTETIQASVLGKFYLAFLKEQISWSKFCELAEANQRMFLADYEILHRLCEQPCHEWTLQQDEYYETERLSSLGLAQKASVRGITVAELDGTKEQRKRIILTSFGEAFCRYDALDLPAIHAYDL